MSKLTLFSLLTLLLVSKSSIAFEINCGEMTQAQCQKIVDEANAKHLKNSFPSQFMDLKNQLSWSKILPGEFSNGCVGKDGRVDYDNCGFEQISKENSVGVLLDLEGNKLASTENSAAALACREIGGRLPTIVELKNLIRNFDHTEMKCEYDSKLDCPSLTVKGSAEMGDKFGFHYASLWSVSTVNGAGDLGLYYQGAKFKFHYSGRSKLNRVICVSNL